jgi:uncharacterized protein (DUF1778 family)
MGVQANQAEDNRTVLRNTQQTFTIRISDAERVQIARAANRLSKPLTSFVREAALAASARVENKVVVKEKPPPERELVVIEPRTDHHLVDGVCEVLAGRGRRGRSSLHDCLERENPPKRALSGEGGLA